MRIHICDLNAESPETGAHYGGRGFSHSSLSKVLLALIVLQMRPAKAINATWAAPEGTADTFLEVLDKTIMSYMKKNNPINDELPPLWSTFLFYQKAHTYCRLGFDSVLSAPFKSIAGSLQLLQDRGGDWEKREKRVDRIKVSMTNSEILLREEPAKTDLDMKVSREIG